MCLFLSCVLRLWDLLPARDIPVLAVGPKPCTERGVLGLGVLSLEASVPRPVPMGRSKLPVLLPGVLQGLSTQAKEVEQTLLCENHCLAKPEEALSPPLKGKSVPRYQVTPVKLQITPIMAPQVYYYICYIHKGPLKWRNSSSGAVSRGGVARYTLYSLCWMFRTEPSVPLLKKMSFSCVPIAGFLSRVTFSHNQNISTTYLVSHTFRRSGSGSGSTT